MPRSPLPRDQDCLADVAPLTPLPLSRAPFFTYLGPADLEVGSLVAVPIGRRTVRGIVLAVRPRTAASRVPYRYRPISAVLEAALLTPGQLALTRHIADTCLTPLGRVLVHSIPPPPARRAVRNRGADTEVDSPSSAPVRWSTAQKAAARFIKTPAALKRPTLVTGPSGSGKTELLLSVARSLTRRAGQALILLPEVGLAEEVFRRAARYAPGRTALVHSRLTRGAYRAAWERIRNGEAAIVVGTRQAVFAPFTDLRLVAVDEEQDESYKQWDMAPRYDAREAASVLARQTGAREVSAAVLPRLETWRQAETGRLNHCRLPRLPGRAAPAVVLANLREERYRQNFSPLSRPLAEALEHTLSRGRQALLFINHAGMSRFSVCEQCRTPLRCPDCGRALVLSETGQFVCLHCPYRSGPFLRCPVCRGHAFRHVGFGTERVAREVRRRFPHARLGRIDRSVLAQPREHARLLSAFRAGRIDVLIGTQAAIKGFHAPGVSLVGAIDADHLLAPGDFRAEEKLLHKLGSVIGRVADSEGQAVIQTFHPENPLFRALTGDAEAAFRELLPDREAFGFPPFVRLLLIRGTAREVSVLERETARLLDVLQRAVSETPGTRVETLSRPAAPRGRAVRHLLLRWPAGEPLPVTVLAVLRRLASGPVVWAFDVDPTVFP